tara:strand:- start:278 stop:421 length:144 start_codon:yes stop_codon:yes gene_type:complete
LGKAGPFLRTPFGGEFFFFGELFFFGGLGELFLGIRGFSLMAARNAS